MNLVRDPGHGFAEPVFDAQSAFRALLDALSHPGRVFAPVPAGFVAPSGLPAAAAAGLLTLADHDTPVWLAGGANHPAAHWLAFHGGARAVAEPSEAAFAVLDGAAAAPRLADFPAGEDRYPDRSATVFVLVDALEGGPRVRLTGPGIRDAVTIAPTGLRPGFWAEVAANARRYPLGVDLLLVAGDRVVGLPRTTRAIPEENV